MKKTNRYVVAMAGVLLHLMLGSTYAWSVYRNPIMQQTGWDPATVAFAFSLAIFAWDCQQLLWELWLKNVVLVLLGAYLLSCMRQEI